MRHGLVASSFFSPRPRQCIALVAPEPVHKKSMKKCIMVNSVNCNSASISLCSKKCDGAELWMDNSMRRERAEFTKQTWISFVTLVPASFWTTFCTGTCCTITCSTSYALFASSDEIGCPACHSSCHSNVLHPTLGTCCTCSWITGFLRWTTLRTWSHGITMQSEKVSQVEAVYLTM